MQSQTSVGKRPSRLSYGSQALSSSFSLPSSSLLSPVSSSFLPFSVSLSVCLRVMLRWCCAWCLCVCVCLCVCLCVCWERREGDGVYVQNALRVSIENVSVCTGTTRTCFNMCAWCRHTRARFQSRHGGRFESTHGVFSVPHTTTTTTTQHHTTPQQNTTQHNAPQTHHKRTTNTPQTHHKHTTNTPQTHHNNTPQQHTTTTQRNIARNTQHTTHHTRHTTSHGDRERQRQLLVRCDGSARAHEDRPSGRHDVHWVGCSDVPLMEQHRELFC